MVYKIAFPSLQFAISDASPENGKIVLKCICIFSSYLPENTLLQWKSKKVNAVEKNNSFLLSYQYVTHKDTRGKNAEFLNVKPGCTAALVFKGLI